jgi:hypothetical protein
VSARRGLGGEGSSYGQATVTRHKRFNPYYNATA